MYRYSKNKESRYCNSNKSTPFADSLNLHIAWTYTGIIRTSIVLDYGQVLEDADEGHHHQAHSQLLDNSQRIHGWHMRGVGPCRVEHGRVVGISGVQTKLPRQLEVG